jgi:hypothetical protein
MNHREKQNIMNDNKLLCTYGEFKNIPLLKTQKYFYNPELSLPINNNFCFVDVIASDNISIGHKFISLNKNKPVMIMMVDKEFNGANMDILGNITDYEYILKSNFYKTLNDKNLYPLNDGEINFIQNLFIFRDNNYNISENKYSIPAIIFSPIKNPVILGQYMLTDDYLSYQKSIEAIFQGAFVAGLDTLILSDMGIISYGIPVGEFLEIINICILKYCTLFKFIIFAIQPKNQRDLELIDLLIERLVKPQYLNVSNNSINPINPINSNHPNQQNHQMINPNNQMINPNHQMINNQMINPNKQNYN